jgi:hypothetical protein
METLRLAHFTLEIQLVLSDCRLQLELLCSPVSDSTQSVTFEVADYSAPRFSVNILTNSMEGLMAQSFSQRPARSTERV